MGFANNKSGVQITTKEKPMLDASTKGHVFTETTKTCSYTIPADMDAKLAEMAENEFKKTGRKISKSRILVEVFQRGLSYEQ